MAHTEQAATPLPLRALEAALAKAVELDPATAKRLGSLEGRRVSVTLSPPGLQLAMRVDAGQLRLSIPAENSEPADLAVSMPPTAILAQLARAASGQSSAAKGVQVSGDAELARAVFELARAYQPDAAELLTPLFGDVLGEQIAQGLAGAVRFAKRSAEHLARNTREYLREESRDLIAPEEMNQWIGEIDDLRDDVARAEARIARLRQSR